MIWSVKSRNMHRRSRGLGWVPSLSLPLPLALSLSHSPLSHWACQVFCAWLYPLSTVHCFLGHTSCTTRWMRNSQVGQGRAGQGTLESSRVELSLGHIQIHSNIHAVWPRPGTNYRARQNGAHACILISMQSSSRRGRRVWGRVLVGVGVGYKERKDMSMHTHK